MSMPAADIIRLGLAVLVNILYHVYGIEPPLNAIINFHPFTSLVLKDFIASPCVPIFSGYLQAHISKHLENKTEIHTVASAFLDRDTGSCWTFDVVQSHRDFAHRGSLVPICSTSSIAERPRPPPCNAVET